ncbi:MAG: Na(+)/H(+) antiporter subunit D [Methanoregulaceae archaeon]|nr:Na(+)/H(+) antiporter subunit D [Methanoregulaceae archaeon]
MDSSQWALILTVAIPFIAACLIIALRSRPDAREAASLIAAVLTFLCAAYALPSAFTVSPVSTPAAGLLPGLSVQFAADALGILFATLASFLWIFTTVYSIGYMRGRKEHAQTRYYACFAVVIGATMGIALSTNLFSLFIFYEILTVATYPLVVHAETPEAFAAGRKYLIYTLSGGVAILAGMMILQGMGPALSFIPGGNPALAGIAPDFARLAFLLLMGGFGVKAALVPLHGWLPSAMVAPTPVSGLLHAVAVVKAGVFGLLRVVLYLYGPGLMTGLSLQYILIAAAIVTILVGSILALLQDDFKLRLAYSTVSQLSYIILGAAILLPEGVTGVTDAGRAAAIIGAAFMISAHAFSKLAMFFVAGAVAVETGKTKISELDGIGRKMPGAFIAFTLATLSMAGLPPMAGFIAKWFLSVGAWNAGDWWILVIFVVSSVLNLAYFLPIIIRAFFRPWDGAPGGPRWTLGVPAGVTAAAALVTGLWTAIPGGPFELSAQVAATVTHTTLLAAGSFAWSPVVPPFLIFLVGGPLVLLLRGRARQIGLVALAGLALVSVLSLPGGYFAGPVAGGVSLWELPFMGYTLVLLRVDGLSYLVGVIFAIITFLAVLYAAVAGKPRIQLFALLYAGVSLGAVFAGDWISVLVFWELMAIASTFLIWQEGGEAIGAGYRYFLWHCISGVLLGSGIALLYFGGGSPVVGPLAGLGTPVMEFWASLFITLGIGVNVCFILMHTWLTDAYPKANFVASVFLSIYTTKLAVYLLARAQPGTELVAFMGAAMAVYGVFFAVFQTDMRKLLSYHIVSQVGYMVAGVGIAGWLGMADTIGQLGLDGGMAHVFNHILYKALLFMAIGVIIWKTGENTMTRLGGLQKKMPVTAIAFWIAAFSIAGLPLFNGFVSKGMVLMAAQHTNVLIWVLLEIASFGTFLSFLKLGYFTFLRPGKTEASDPPLPMQAAMLGTAALCIAIGVYPQMLYAILPVPTTFEAYGLEQVGMAVLVLGAAAVFFFTVGKKILEPHETKLRDVDVVYLAAGRATVMMAEGLQDAFGAVYRGAVKTGSAFFSAGRALARLENRDLNWCLAAFVGILVIVLCVLLLGVQA